jgi:hypothetical protein
MTGVEPQKARQEEKEPVQSGPVPVNIIVRQQDDKVTVTFDRPLNYLVMEPVAAIRIGEMLKEKGIEILRQDAI